MRALLVAVVLDLAFGEVPSRRHPAAWIGRLIAAGRALPARPRPSSIATRLAREGIFLRGCSGRGVS
jgi:cobalamin biosynthesis protein CobD/CbiB